MTLYWEYEREMEWESQMESLTTKKKLCKYKFTLGVYLLECLTVYSIVEQKDNSHKFTPF